MYYGGIAASGMSWIWFLIIPLALGGLAQFWVRSTYTRFSGVPTSTGLSGAEAARRLLDAEGLDQVTIEMTPGELSDHYDPRSNVLRLSRGVHEGRSVAAAGVAAHEAGHAIQHARRYVFATVRTAIVPVANIGSQAAWILIPLGLILRMSGLAWLGVALFGAAVLFQIVTLPVELDASHRALVALGEYGILDDVELPGARKVLTAAAMTYVVAALISVMYLLRFIGLARRS